ncbi:MAG: hypothetical protein JSW06_03185 [Thermoplasmatales archaeon]|nr:MAG: hypothetical protein JSW06_03185 [Thermoplasmatales archaeon]
MYKTQLTRLPVYLIVFVFLLVEASLIINCQPLTFTDQDINNVLSDEPQLLPPRMEWDCTYGFQNTDTANSVEQTSDSGYIFTGKTWHTESYPSDVWLLKTDNEGNEIWNKTFHNQYGDIGNYVQQTNDNGYIIIGGNTVSTGGVDDVLLIKTDSEGNEQWNKTFGGPYGDNGAYGQQTNDNGYIIVGYTHINVTHLDSQIWVIKTDENGNEHWNRTYGGNHSEWGTFIQQTNDNGYIILGNNDTQIILLKTDENGLAQWYKTYGQRGLYYAGYKVEQTIDNGYIIMGYVRHWDLLDNYVNILLIRTDENGNILWMKIYQKYNFDFCWDGQLTSDGGIICVGTTNPPGQDIQDIWVIEIDAYGDLIWERTFGGQFEDCAHSIQQTNDNGYILAGYTHLNNQSDKDAYLIKLAANTIPKPSLIAGTITNLQDYTNYTIFNAKNTILFQLNPLRFNYYFTNEEIIVGNDKIGLLNDKIILGIFNSNI